MNRLATFNIDRSGDLWVITSDELTGLIATGHSLDEALRRVPHLGRDLWECIKETDTEQRKAFAPVFEGSLPKVDYPDESELRAKPSYRDLNAAAIECLDQLNALSMGTEGHSRTMICRASNVLSAALRKPLSSHGEGK